MTHEYFYLALMQNVAMASLLAMPRVCVLVPWRDSGEMAHRTGTINGVPRPRRIEICANTGRYVHVRCEKGP